jgi:hypothetical protein
MQDWLELEGGGPRFQLDREITAAIYLFPSPLPILLKIP